MKVEVPCPLALPDNDPTGTGPISAHLGRQLLRSCSTDHHRLQLRLYNIPGCPVLLRGGNADAHVPVYAANELRIRLLVSRMCSMLRWCML